MVIQYIEGNDVRSILDFTRDNILSIRNRTNSLLSTVDGLMGGDLQYDDRSPLIMLELVSGMIEKVEDARDRLVVDLLHLEEPPATNAIARAAKISVTRLKAIDAVAEALPDNTEE